MPPSRARMLPLALVLAACAHDPAPTPAPPEPEPATTPAPADPVADPAEPPAPATPPPGDRTARQVTFDDDADPEPTTQIQGAPKRPPMPRFRLFGTRDGDGPN